MTKNATIKQFIALSLIAISAIIGGFSVQTLIKSQKSNALIINLSGMQRMHSQRIAFFANSLYLSNDSIEIERHKSVILELKDKMQHIHQTLLYGNDSINFTILESKSLMDIYFEPPINLNQQVDIFLKETDAFVNSNDTAVRRNAFHIINTYASGRLLISLDQAVSQFVKETNQRIHVMEIRGIIAVVFIIMLLILEFVFVFKPLITANIDKEKKLKKQNKRLEHLNQDLKQFIYATSHDLKTPVRGLHSLVEFFEADFSDTLRENSKDYLVLIKSRVKRINALIDGLMRFGVISSEPSVAVAFDLNPLLNRLIKNYQAENIVIDVTSDLPIIIVNPVLVEEIFKNLIENAIRYNDKPICEISVGHTENSQFYQFYVRDNGIGIDKKYHEKIFKLFQTLVVDKENPTAGIGLAIVKRIVNELGGKVWIDSVENEYFTLYFTILKGEMG